MKDLRMKCALQQLREHYTQIPPNIYGIFILLSILITILRKNTQVLS